MDNLGIRQYMQRFEDKGYKTWIKTTMIMECLKTRLGSFLENETAAFHTALRGGIKLNQTECIGRPKCKIKNLKQHQVPNTLCGLCDAWKKEILAKHTTKSMVYWNNSTPHLWPSHKWEVAKVYMPRGNQNHQSVDDFDISAFLNLMTFCAHFQSFVKNQTLTKVTSVRNKVMHSPNFAVSDDDFHTYVGWIRDLGEALGEKIPEFRSFNEDMAEVQNIDFQLTFGDQLQSYKDDKYDMENILSMELNIMKDKMEYLSQLYDANTENMLTSEELQKVKSFLDINFDLQEKLKPQWQRLEAVQAQHGQQINTLTERVGELEKRTECSAEEFSTETVMFKNRLLERAIKYKWAKPVFSERDESYGFRGQVEVNGKSFLGSQVCKSKTQAHQEVARKALQELVTEIANEEAALCQADQPQSVSKAGPSFFAAVSVSLNVDVSSDTGGSAPVDRVECVYEKLVSLFGLHLPDTGLSNKETVLQYCDEHNVPPPVERTIADACHLTLVGKTTFYDLEGSTRRGLAEHQAARVALKALEAVLAKVEVFNNNHIGALLELLVRFKQPGRPEYRVTESPGGGGARVTWLPGADPAAGQAQGGHGNEEAPSAAVEGAPGAIAPHAKRMWTSDSDVPGKLKKLQPVTARNDLPDAGQFLGSVQVTIQVVRQPCQAADQQGAVGASYSDLMKALSLRSDSTSSGEEKQAVLEFFQQAQGPPPVETIDETPNGTYSCSLRIGGKLTFQSSESTSTKKDSEHLAAQKALTHLEGLQTVKDVKLCGVDNYKGRLQKVAADLGNISVPMYKTEDAGMVTDGGRFSGSVHVTIQAVLPACQAADEEGAVGAAYSDLMNALSVTPGSTGGARESVLEFMQLTKCRPPEEGIEKETCGTYKCVLKINGQFIFQSPERTATKKEAEKLSALQALRHLEGLAPGKGTPVHQNTGGHNYKGRLQELLMGGLGSAAVPVYSVVDCNDPHQN